MAAAEEAFATGGMGVPVDEIAKRAGVGVGTVYRHYPTKAALLQAVVMAQLGKFVERAKQLSVDCDCTTALFTVLGELVQLAVDKRDLTEELAREGVPKEAIHAAVKQDLEHVISTLWVRAQEASKVRSDITSEDLNSLISATCMAAGQRGRSAVERLVAVMCDGLRT